MTDILDEILAFTETQHPTKPTHHSAHPRVSLPPDLSTSLHLPPPFAPSPRGVQDDVSAFSLLRPAAYPNPNHPPPPKPELVPIYNPPPDSPPPSPAPLPTSLTPCIPHTTSSTSEQSSLCMPRCSPSKPTLSPPITYESTATPPSDHVTSDLFSLPHHHPNVHAKRALTSSAVGNARGGMVEGGMKKARTGTQGEMTSVVMPPSAKSILERREKAIREGRRKDAKLTETERRILRRLRNRESAERCRLRRVQQAAMLEKKIETMQVENKRLVEQAEEYQRTIQRLERVIREFSAQDKAV